MRRIFTSLFLFKILVAFLFVGVLYLTVFASQQKILAQSIDSLLNQCTSVGNTPDPRDIWDRTSSVNECHNQCSIAYSMCQVRNLCNPISVCQQLWNICDNGCVPAPPPPPPACSGYCQYYISGCGVGGTAPGSCGTSSLICCRPANNCEAAAGRCVSASSQGVAPCPSGMNYNTNISCGSLYQICCTPIGGPPQYPYQYPYPYPYPTPTYDINGYIYIDRDGGGTDNGDPYYTGSQTVRLHNSSGTQIATTDSASGTAGPYSFLNRFAGSYSVRITPPSGYMATTPTSISVTLGPDRSGINFGIVPVYDITGNIFNDVDRDYFRDASESKTWTTPGATFSSTNTVWRLGGNLTYDATAGTFTVNNTLAGTKRIFYNGGMPAGYINRWPVNAVPPFFDVTVGPGCTYSPLHPNTASRAVCNGRGDVSNLWFVITNSIPWWQTYGLDVRMDTGLTNIIPAAPVYPPYASVIDNL